MITVIRTATAFPGMTGEATLATACGGNGGNARVARATLNAIPSWSIWRGGCNTTPMAVRIRSAESLPSLLATVMSRQAASLIPLLRSHPCCSQMRRTLNAAFSQARRLITPKNGERAGQLTSGAATNKGLRTAKAPDVASVEGLVMGSPEQHGRRPSTMICSWRQSGRVPEAAKLCPGRSPSGTPCTMTRDSSGSPGPRARLRTLQHRPQIRRSGFRDFLLG